MSKNKANYIVGPGFVVQEVEGGVRVVWEEEATHAWGEFIASQDFIGEGGVFVPYEATDFTSFDPHYQRQMTEEVTQEAGGVL